MIFNIYYINFPKVYEIKMMFSNVISLGTERQTSESKGDDYEIKSKLGARFLNLFGAELQGNAKSTGSNTQKVLETFEIKTTKSIILNEILEKSKTVSSFNELKEGELIRIDNVLIFR